MEDTGDGVAAVAADRVGLLVVGHGSRRTAANDLLVAVTAEVAGRSAGLRAVAHAFLEVSRPSIRDGFAELVAEGCRHVVVHPYFLYPGAHTALDIPAELAAAGAAAPGVTWVLTEPLNLDPRIVDVVLDRVAAVLSPQPGLHTPPGRPAVIGESA